MTGNRFAKAVVGLVLAGAGLFALVSVLTHSPFDPALAENYPVNNPPHNLCGLAGAYLSSLLLWAHGVGAYAVPVAILAWGVALVATS